MAGRISQKVLLANWHCHWLRRRRLALLPAPLLLLLLLLLLATLALLSLLLLHACIRLRGGARVLLSVLPY